MSLTWNQFINRNVLTTPLESFTGVIDPDTNIGSFPAVNMPDAATTDVYTQILIPANYQAFVAAEAIIVAGGTGNMRRAVATTWGRVGTQDYDDTADAIVAGEVAVVIDVITALDITAALTGIAAGDLVGIKFTRVGGHVDDTVGATCYFLGVRLQYV